MAAFTNGGIFDRIAEVVGGGCLNKEMNVIGVVNTIGDKKAATLDCMRTAK